MFIDEAPKEDGQVIFLFDTLRQNRYCPSHLAESKLTFPSLLVISEYVDVFHFQVNEGGEHLIEMESGLFCLGLEMAHFDERVKPGPFGCGLEMAQVDWRLAPLIGA